MITVILIMMIMITVILIMVIMMPVILIMMDDDHDNDDFDNGDHVAGGPPANLKFYHLLAKKA